MRIVFTGPEFVRRQVGAYTWHRTAGIAAQEVAEAELCAELLTDPSGRFAVAADEPLRLVGGEDALIALALAGIASVQDLARTRPTKALADALAAPLETVRGWVSQARALATPQQEAEPWPSPEQ